MRITTTLAAAASIAVLSTSAFAGGMSEEVMEAPVVMEEMAPAGSGTAGIIALGVLAAILLYAASEE
ncbi:hypothetical protein N8306_03410 [Yoonia sp.]|nr:hypothetical protein [Yoonia sp.]